MKKIFVITGLFIISITVCLFIACASTGTGNSISWSGDFGYEIEGTGENRTITITDYKGKSTEVNIPPEIKGIPVISIYRNVFSSKQLTNVIIPDGVTSIGRSAFSNNRLTSITIPNSVTTIGIMAFYGNNLTSVTIPGSVNEIGGYAFSNNNLVDVNISNGVTTIGGVAFGDNLLTNVIIPDSVREIGESAFLLNPLTSVTIPAGFIKIGNNAFAINRPMNRDINERIREKPDMSVGSFHPYIIAYGSGTYTKEGDRILRNGQSIREPATLITDFTGEGNSYKKGPIYFLSIDGKSPDQCRTTSVKNEIGLKNVNSREIPASLRNATLYYGATYVIPGMHTVEVTYFGVSEHTTGKTTYTNAMWSQDSLTWEYRYLFDGGVYIFTAKPEGDKIVYRIEPQ